MPSRCGGKENTGNARKELRSTVGRFIKNILNNYTDYY